MDDLDSEWRRKGATLSHKTAQEEFGLTWEEIVRAIRAGKLHCQQQSMHGNPWLRLLRREVEALVKEKHGANYLRDRRAKTELARINRELKRLKGQKPVSFPCRDVPCDDAIHGPVSPATCWQLAAAGNGPQDDRIQAGRN